MAAQIGHLVGCISCTVTGAHGAPYGWNLGRALQERIASAKIPVIASEAKQSPEKYSTCNSGLHPQMAPSD